MASGVLIVAETVGAALRGASLELVTAGKAIGGSVTALVPGSGIGAAAEEIAATGVDATLSVDDSRLADFTTDAYAAAVEAAIRQVNPAVVLFTGTTSGRDLAPRVAARFDAPLAANVIALRLDGGSLVATRPVLGGRVQSDVTLTGDLVMASVGPGAFDAASIGSPAEVSVQALNVDFSAVPDRVKVTGIAGVQDAGGAKLESADIIVAGGRGLKEAAHLAGGAAWRCGRGLTHRRRCRLASSPRADRPDGKNRFAASLHRRRRFGRGAAQCRHAGLGLHRRHQPRSRRPDLQARRLRHRRRSLRGRAGIDEATFVSAKDRVPRTENVYVSSLGPRHSVLSTHERRRVHG